MKFEPIRMYPARSPMIVAEMLRPMIVGKTVVDLGCAEGDIMMGFLECGAKEVIGIESKEERAKIAIDRGLNVIIGAVGKVEIPQADLYYNWLNFPTVKNIINNLWNTIIVTGDYTAWPGVDEQIGGIELDLPITEKPNEVFKIHIIDKRGQVQHIKES